MLTPSREYHADAVLKRPDPSTIEPSGNRVTGKSPAAKWIFDIAIDLL